MRLPSEFCYHTMRDIAEEQRAHDLVRKQETNIEDKLVHESYGLIKPLLLETGPIKFHELLTTIAACLGFDPETSIPFGIRVAAWSALAEGKISAANDWTITLSEPHIQEK